MTHEGDGVTDEGGEQIGKIVDGEPDVVELHLQQVAIAQRGQETPGQAQVPAPFLRHPVRGQQIDQEPHAPRIDTDRTPQSLGRPGPVFGQAVDQSQLERRFQDTGINQGLQEFVDGQKVEAQRRIVGRAVRLAGPIVPHPVPLPLAKVAFCQSDAWNPPWRSVVRRALSRPGVPTR